MLSGFLDYVYFVLSLVVYSRFIEYSFLCSLWSFKRLEGPRISCSEGLKTMLVSLLVMTRYRI